MKSDSQTEELLNQHFYARVQISRRELEGRLSSDVQWDLHSRHLLLTLHQEIAGNPLCDVDEEWPANWWEAFKERWFPRFLLRRFPVQQNRIRIRAAELATKLRLPDHWGPLHYMKVDRSYNAKDN